MTTDPGTAPASPAAGAPPPGPGAAPWEVPPPWALARQRSNPPARWALVLGIAAAVPGVGLGAVVAGVLGLVRAQRSRGAGRTAALVGLALGAAFLLLDAGLGAAAATGWLPLHHAAPAASSADGSAEGGGDGGGDGRPEELPDPRDRTNSDLSATEQAYIDRLADVTYLNFDDSTLIAMGHLACRDFDAGRTPGQDSDRQLERYAAGGGDAWDVQRAATTSFCPQHAGLLTSTSPTVGT